MKYEAASAEQFPLNYDARLWLGFGRYVTSRVRDIRSPLLCEIDEAVVTPVCDFKRVPVDYGRDEFSSMSREERIEIYQRQEAYCLKERDATLVKAEAE